MYKKFSVLMSVYYKEKPKYLEKSLESILNQSILPDEIIIIEDGPLTSELYEVLDKFLKLYENIRIIKFELNKGLGEALRVGVLECRNEIIMRMDTDDISKNNRFEEQLKIFNLDSKIDVVGSFIEEFEEDIHKGYHVLGIRNVPENNTEIYKCLKLRNAINHPTVAFKKSKVLLAGNYMETYNKLEDYFLWVRMALKGSKFYNIQESLLYFRVTENTSKRRAGIRMWINDIKLHSYFYKEGFISLFEFIRNIIVWGIYRTIPSKFHYKLKNFIRK